jgi:hypothetical protein
LAVAIVRPIEVLTAEQRYVVAKHAQVERAGRGHGDAHALAGAGLRLPSGTIEVTTDGSSGRNENTRSVALGDAEPRHDANSAAPTTPTRSRTAISPAPSAD